MRSIFKALAPLSVALILLSATPAFSSSSSCLASLAKLLNQDCTTGAVQANPSGHFVYFEVGPLSSFEVFDAENGNFVQTGQTGVGIHTGNVFGLFGFYKVHIHITLASSYAYINNT